MAFKQLRISTSASTAAVFAENFGSVTATDAGTSMYFNFVLPSPTVSRPGILPQGQLAFDHDSALNPVERERSAVKTIFRKENRIATLGNGAKTEKSARSVVVPTGAVHTAGEIDLCPSANSPEGDSEEHVFRAIPPLGLTSPDSQRAACMYLTLTTSPSTRASTPPEANGPANRTEVTPPAFTTL